MCQNVDLQQLQYLETMTHQPYNDDNNYCKLNDCLQCDEDHSGPIFQLIAGRTRRNSGLLSAIARPCKSIANITQESCPMTRPLD